MVTGGREVKEQENVQTEKIKEKFLGNRKCT